MAVNVKLGVDVSGFKKGIAEAESSVKTFDAALARNEAQLKNTGDAETYMTQKVSLLNGQIEAQKKVVDQITTALQTMQNNGVDPNSKGYQTMAQNLFKAQTKLLDMETNLKNVGKESQNTDTQLNNIGKNVSWQTVTDGLKRITDGLESGARAAVNFGKKIMRSAMDSASWADDILTRSTEFGVDPETLQRMENVADYIDTDVDTILSAKDRLAKSQKPLSELLGISTEGKSVDDVFWEAGEAIMNLGEGFDKAEIAQQIFGKSWRELLPLFTAGREEYEAMLQEQNVLSNEQVEALGNVDDRFQEIQNQIELIKNQFWAENADKITELLQWLIDNKDGVVAAITGIAGAFGAMKIGEFALNLGKVIDGFKTLGLFGGKQGATGSAAEAASAVTGGGTAAGGGFAASLKAGVLNMGKTIPFMLPMLFGANAVADIVSFVREGLQGGAASVERSENIRQNYSDYAGYSIWDALNNYTSVGGDNTVMADQAKMDDLVDRYWKWFNDEITDQSMDHLVNDLMNQEQYDAFHEAMELYSNGNNIYDSETREALENAFTTARQLLEEDMAKEAVNVDIEPVVPEGTAASIASQIGTVTVPVAAQVSGAAPHANGLSYVPYDNYLAYLHKGERVVPAREVGSSRNFSSNLYVESMYMNNGQDAEGLASAMAAANRRTMSGFGS